MKAQPVSIVVECADPATGLIALRQRFELREETVPPKPPASNTTGARRAALIDVLNDLLREGFVVVNDDDELEEIADRLLVAFRPAPVRG
jgi:hypothetical protein